MKLVIGWLSLTVILPLIYLFCWKKSWRLPVGTVILVILGISVFAPGEIVNSLVNRKLKKELHDSVHQRKQSEEQLENLHKKDFSSLSSSENLEKIALEKEISELDKWIKKEKSAWEEWKNNGEKGPKPNTDPLEFHEKREKLRMKRDDWIKKWSGEKPTPPLLFPGKELTQWLEKLSKNKEEHEFKGKKYKQYSVIIIDLKDAQIEPVQKEIVDLVNKEEEYNSTKILWFKNIDKVKKDSELEKFLLDLLDKREKRETWKYKERDYNFFDAVVVATANHTQNLSSALQTKLNHYEPFLDKHQLIIMGITGVVEVIIFFILIRISRKSKNLTKLK